MKKVTLAIAVFMTVGLIIFSSGCTEEERKQIIDEVIPAIDSALNPEPESAPESPSTTTQTPGAVEHITMNFDFWTKVNTGQWEETAEGIKVYGAGYRFGHQGVQSRDTLNFVGSETFIKWKVNGGSGNYAQFGVYLMGDYDIKTGGYNGIAHTGLFTTDHSWNDSLVIDVDTWYYTRITVNADSAYTTVTSTGTYDINGGASIYTGTGDFENAGNGSIVVIFNDNYGGTETYLVVGEAKTTAPESSTPPVTTPPPAS